MTETTEDMKLTKFKIIIEKIHKYFHKDQSKVTGFTTSILRAFYRNKTDLVYYPKFLNKYGKDKYVNALSNLLRHTSQLTSSDDGCFPRDESEYIQTVMVTKHIYRNRDPFTEADLKLDRDCLIFWLLFLAAINKELYNNELPSIIDLAYCLKFDEAMIRDWCHAVKYVLENNQLNEKCDLQCETDAGRKFFLHQNQSESITIS